VVSVRHHWPLFLAAEKLLTAKVAKKSREGREEDPAQSFNQQSTISNQQFLQ
jgi:hypothetical protein